MKSFTNIEQSKKLEEILPVESADMWYWEWPSVPFYKNYEHPMFHKGEGEDIHNVPCWSLAALLELLPKDYLIEANKKTTRTLYHITAISGEVTHYHQDLVDAAVELLLKLYNKNIHEHRTD